MRLGRLLGNRSAQSQSRLFNVPGSKRPYVPMRNRHPLKRYAQDPEFRGRTNDTAKFHLLDRYVHASNTGITGAIKDALDIFM